jgi:uncharacterized protein
MEKHLNNNQVLVISHIGDPDGMGSVILATIAFKKIDYLLCEINESTDYINYLKESNYEHVYICDLSIDNEKQVDELSTLNKNILLFDHHRTNLYANKYPFAKVNVELNGRNTSATELFYDYLIQNKLLKESIAIKEFVENIRSYDVWDWQKDNNLVARDLSTLFGLIGTTNFINKFVKCLPEMNHFIISPDDQRLIDTENNNVLDLVNNANKNIIIVKIDNKKVGITFSDHHQSILGNEMCKSNDIDYAMIIDVIDNKVSLRSINTDVSIIAQKYGGGGHIHASGFFLTKEILIKLLKIIVNRD